ncbi:TetR/AcrR family transcriptional regulator [Solirhodobacter olei]|uniref:TetR/AcrR family transcriptional regulator n=1 Tax=Solirhodobacter olei TaxID=2493082 RepID=UPI000FD6E4D4|nr:TetR/AcrR family transcriptional regulator [Solirhodobacter olei]
MSREMVRQGGRSARIQKAVHEASRQLLDEMDRTRITVPMIAERAGVTPSTIYRRWGTLTELMADVAVERLRPAAAPEDTGSTAGDLESFVLQYAEEMSSPVGRALLRDVIAEAQDDDATIRCCQYTHDHLAEISARATARGEPPLDVAGVLDRTIAPICYHILFGDREVTPDYCRTLLTGAGGPG